MKAASFAACLITALLAGPAQAQAPNDPEVEACRSTGLPALRERSPSMRDLILDMDTPVRTIIMGDAYPERKETGKSQRFLRLIGEKRKVLLTFFTER